MKKKRKLSTLGVLALLSTQVYAAGYKLEFQSTSVLADAGDAAVVEDVGTNWYNSAGLVDLPQQLVVSDIYMYQQVTFKGSQTAPSPFGPAFSYAATGSASNYGNINLPAIHYGLPFKDRYAVGVSIVPAWGLLEDYGDESLVRYGLSRIYTRTIDIAPSFAMRVTPQWSFGIGPDFHYFALQQKFAARTQGPAGLGGTTNDSVSRISADSWSPGMHIGVLFRYSDATRIGLNYRSRIVQKLVGYSDFAINGDYSNTLESNQFRLNLPMPPTTTLSIYHDFTPVWAMMGSIAYDQWSVVRHLHGLNYITPTGTTNVVIPQDFSNTFDLGIGTHYKWNDKLLLRASFKYEPTPTNDTYRDVNFPDGEKFGFNFGARYQVAPKMALDFLYAHVYTRTVPINNTSPISGVNTNGRSDTTLDLLGAQLVWDV